MRDLHDFLRGLEGAVKRQFMNTTAVASGLLDANGNPIPAQTVDVRSLPEIARDGLPGLPDDIEARLMGGEELVIVLWHRASDLHVEMPLLDRSNLPRYVEALQTAALRQAMGEAPEGNGYRVRAE
jgi:hypothetical protein